MKRKSILALNLTTILLVSISLFGCGSTYRTRNNDATRQDSILNDGIRGGNNGVRGGYVDDGTGAGGTTQNNATGSNDTTNVSDATKDRIKATADSIRYGAANFKSDLTNAGYNVTESTNIKKDYFKGNETDYLLGGDVVRLYEYNSPAELEGDVNRIAPNGMTINGTNANYNTRPYYYRKGNTLIVYEGKEPAYVDEFGRIYGNPLRP
jgi:hypothetical protein